MEMYVLGLAFQVGTGTHTLRALLEIRQKTNFKLVGAFIPHHKFIIRFKISKLV